MGAELHTSIDDAALPAAAALLAPSAGGVVARALAGASVASTRVDYASYHPGERVLVAYDAELMGSDGSTSRAIVVATSRRDGLPEGVRTLQLAGVEVGVWPMRADPSLPGLGAATDRAVVRRLLDELGGPPGEIELRTRSYWPENRAVVEVFIPEERRKAVFRPGQGMVEVTQRPLAFLKVVRPAEAEALARAHRELSTRLPVPACHGVRPELGIVVLEARSGQTLYDWVLEGGTPVPGAPELLELLEELGRFEAHAEPVETSREVARRSARLLSALVPATEARLDGLLERLGPDAPGALVTAHNDFHEYQLLVQGGKLSGLLDLDDVAPGERADDLATMVARFWSFAHFEQSGRPQLERYALELLEGFGAVVDPAELRLRVGAVLLSRATSPFRDQEPGWPGEIGRHLDVAEEWLRG